MGSPKRHNVDHERGRRPLGAGLKTALCAAVVWTGVFAAPVVTPLAPAAQAAIPAAMPASVRVALFIDTGRYSSPASAVTLSADTAALALGLRDASGFKPLHQVNAKEAVRAYANGYYALLPQSADAAVARAQAQKLAVGGAGTGIVQRSKQGKPAYAAYIGPFPTKEAAAAAAKADATAQVAGPLGWNAGVYATEPEAQAQADAIVQAGFDADVALIGGGFAVMVGGAADDASLKTLKDKVSAALPAARLTAVDQTAGYVLKRSELSVSGDGAVQPVTAFVVGGGAKLWAAPVDPKAGVQVAERSNRSYRGGIEVTTLNGKLAVINELAIDQYLYSVVGSELNSSWPAEALKAQAIAARTYALKQGDKYQIANVSDSTADQVYKGREAEFAAAIQAVDATKGQVLTYKNTLIDPLFYSNAGGMTADSSEVWGNPVPYLKSVPSPDEGAQAGKKPWYRIVLPSGLTGYIHSDYARDTGTKNEIGLPYYESTTDAVNIRSAPFVDNAANPAIAKVDAGSRFVVIGQMMESNAFAWVRGPFDEGRLREKLGASLPASAAGGITRLEVTKRGPSGRALEVSVNGQAVKASYPDALRSLLGGLPSTRFEIEQSERYTIRGAGSAVREQSASDAPLYFAGGSGTPQAYEQEQFFVLSADGNVKPVSKTTQFVFKGTGFGHGLGMSQWGAKGYAELGYDYVKILQAYYSGVTVTTLP
ncbi:SpoIID/LytB domain-containing protein [Paenibacillus validus]|uniref:SpoIID/LytB domain-containing protein n=1 Tax=Paenibacillus validus TaxID=44253 RepID=UPI003D2771F0